MPQTDSLLITPWFLGLASLLLGLVIGSFLNVVIYRLPRMMQREWQAQIDAWQGQTEETTGMAVFNLALPASHCPHCQQAIRARDNIPLLSYLCLRGRCRHCETPIPPRYPLIEALCALMSFTVVLVFGLQWLTLAALVLSWTLLALTVIDIDHQLLPDSLTLPLLWLGLLVNSQQGFVPLDSAVYGAAIGYLVLWAVYWVFRLLTGREGMGYGDFKLLAALGAWLGWQALPLVILLSSLTGALVGLSLMLLRGQSRHIPIPFGPFLATAGFLFLLAGESLQAIYLTMMGLQ